MTQVSFAQTELAVQHLLRLLPILLAAHHSLISNLIAGAVIATTSLATTTHGVV